jgi:hypothetical protein
VILQCFLNFKLYLQYFLGESFFIFNSAAAHYNIQ